MLRLPIAAVLVLIFVSLVTCVEYERLKGFHMDNGQELSARTLPKDFQQNFNVNWNIYQFITVSFADFDQDESVEFKLFSESHEKVFKDIAVAAEQFEIPISGVMPGTYSLIITGEQSGQVATMEHLNIGAPKPIRF